MAIKNYSTKVPPSRTLSEVTMLLVSKGASSVSTEFKDLKPCGISFAMIVGGVLVNFSLPSNVDGVAKAMTKPGYRPNAQTIVQAEWVAWRILKDWVAAQIALVESHQAEMGQVFMPYALQGGRTMYAAFVEHNQKMLGDGGRS